MVNDPAIMRCPECGVSWMYGGAPKHAMTCPERPAFHETTGLSEEQVLDALDKIKKMRIHAGLRVSE